MNTQLNTSKLSGSWKKSSFPCQGGPLSPWSLQQLRLWLIVPTIFKMAISEWKKGSKGYKFLTFPFSSIHQSTQVTQYYVQVCVVTICPPVLCFGSLFIQFQTTDKFQPLHEVLLSHQLKFVALKKYSLKALENGVLVSSFETLFLQPQTQK